MINSIHDVRIAIGALHEVASNDGCITFMMPDKTLVKLPDEVFNDKVKLSKWVEKFVNNG